MKILRNLCLHFARQDGQDGKKQKENHAIKATKNTKNQKMKILDERNQCRIKLTLNNMFAFLSFRKYFQLCLKVCHNITR